MFNFFKKKKIPEELPEMPAIEGVGEIEEKSEDKEAIKNHLNLQESDSLVEPEKEKKEGSEKTGQEEVKKENLFIKSPEIEDSFFSELQNNLLKEVDDLNKLERWYSNKFLPGDIVNDMREYWENKKAGSIIQILGKNLQEEISEKIAALQELEKEWQEIYFKLIEKEGEIKDKEKELKKTLGEFIELCKRRKRKK